GEVGAGIRSQATGLQRDARGLVGVGRRERLHGDVLPGRWRDVHDGQVAALGRVAGDQGELGAVADGVTVDVRLAQVDGSRGRCRFAVRNLAVGASVAGPWRGRAVVAARVVAAAGQGERDRRADGGQEARWSQARGGQGVSSVSGIDGSKVTARSMWLVVTSPVSVMPSTS